MFFNHITTFNIFSQPRCCAPSIMITPGFSSIGFGPSLFSPFGFGCCCNPMPAYGSFLFGEALGFAAGSLIGGIASLFSRRKQQAYVPMAYPQMPMYNPYMQQPMQMPFYNPPITPQINTFPNLNLGSSTTLPQSASTSNFYNPPIVPQVNKEQIEKQVEEQENRKQAEKARAKEAEDKAREAAEKAKADEDNANANAASQSAATQPTASSSSAQGQGPTGNEPEGVVLNKDKSKYGPEFLAKVKKIANNLKCNYRDLLAVMNAESGISASIKNPHGSATGLIQFLESTAQGLGTTTAKLAQMEPIEQLDYVERYLQRAKSSAGFSSSENLSGGDLYSLVFLPGRAKRDVLTEKGEVYYNSNYRTDINGDGKITKDELTQRIKRFYVSDKTFVA